MAQPNPFSNIYESELDDIERRKALAQALQGQALQPQQARQAGRFVVAPSPLEGLGKLAQAYMLQKFGSKADAEKKALGERYSADLQNTIRRASEAASGTPAQMSEDAAGNATSIPASAPDLNRAAAIYLQHPATQALGLQLSQQEAMDKRRMALLAQALGPRSPAGTPAQALATPTTTNADLPGAVAKPPALPNLQGMNQTAISLLMSGDPTLVRLGEMIQGATKPTDKMRELSSRGIEPGSPQWNAELGMHFNQGGAWQVGPNGQVQLAPGYAQGAGAIKSAEEGARAGFDLVEIPDGRGGTVRMSREQALRMLQPGGGGAAGGGANTLGNTNNAVSAPPRPGGGFGYTPPAAQSGAQQKFAETLATTNAKAYGELQEADRSAPGTISKYQRLGSLLSNVNTGKFKTNTAELKAAAKSLGFDLNAVGIGDDVAPSQAAAALSNQLALELRNPTGGAGMPGAMSDQDRVFLQRMVPGLENDPNAIPLMIEYRTRLAQRDQQIAKMARDYKKKSGTFDEGFNDQLAEWANRNALFTDADVQKVMGLRRPQAPSGFRVLGVEGE